jgi:tetratricopeptide (TPR) repeat protein
MTPRVPNGTGLLPAPAALFLMIVTALLPASGFAAEPFPGYPEKVREQAVRVVRTASPAQREGFAREVRTLRKLMFDHGILSLNAVPDLLYERAVKEGWTRQASGTLREATRVAPLSVPLWAWLLRDDIAHLAPERFLSDVEGLAGAVRAFVPALPGCAAWLMLLVSAAAYWFAAWASILLLLRGRKALTADASRMFRTFPRPEIPAALLVWGCFVAPVVAGAGVGACAVFWIAVSAGYLRRGELVIAVTAIVLLAGAFLFGGALDSLGRLAGGTRTGAWLGVEGYFPGAWPAAPSTGDPAHPGPQWEGMVRFGKARAEMQAGSLQAAEQIWSELIREGEDVAGSYNNRGVVRARLGKTEDALSDFESAVAQTPAGGPAHWNAYQLYLGTFRLEQAARIQSVAWASIGKMPPFDFQAEEMTHGELVPSPLPAKGIWRNLFSRREGRVREAGGSPTHALFFRLLPRGWIPAFLAAGCLWAAVWILLSQKVWLHCACRSCGTLTMVARTRETNDICNSCRAQVGGGVRGGEEREQRILNIRLHRRYVRACSILVPGSGALWAGKEVQAMAYGGALCTLLGALTVSLGALATSQGLISDLQALVAGVAIACVALAWAGGARWGWRSFEVLQLQYNVAGEGT